MYRKPYDALECPTDICLASRVVQLFKLTFKQMELSVNSDFVRRFENSNLGVYRPEDSLFRTPPKGPKVKVDTLDKSRTELEQARMEKRKAQKALAKATKKKGKRGKTASTDPETSEDSDDKTTPDAPPTAKKIMPLCIEHTAKFVGVDGAEGCVRVGCHFEHVTAETLGDLVEAKTKKQLLNKGLSKRLQDFGSKTWEKLKAARGW